MKRKLLRQIANEWRGNIWLALELLIVSVVMWYIIDCLFVSYSTYNEPRGFDTEHCYLIKFDNLSERSADYREYTSYEDYSNDLLSLFDRIGARPEVEAIGMGVNSYFYNGSNSNTILSTDTFTINLTRRMVSPEFPLVFHIEGANGESPTRLYEILRDQPDALLCSDNFMEKYGYQSGSDFIGRQFGNWADNDSLTLKATFKTARYNDFVTAHHSQSMMRSVSRDQYARFFNEMFVRVKENMDHDFIAGIMADATQKLRSGNWYISNVQSFDDIRAMHQQGNYTSTRNRYVVMIFLAVNIFLGLLGTFWFRTRTRIPEIAIRKANGATRADIFRRVMGEGELLLIVVTPVAAVIDWLIAHFEYNTYYDGYTDPTRFAFCVAATFALMSVMIVAGTAIPAWRAMRLQPALALKEE